MYTIEGEIGRGGMGVVYRARDEKLKRPVAIKVLPPELAYRPDIRARFMREAETAARLSHPHIVPIHTVGEADDLVYFVMGLVEGESLAVRIKRRGRLSIDESRRIFKETADALYAAHQQGVIHRDVKPDNILLEGTRGRVMVTDFGIAKAPERRGRHPHRGRDRHRHARLHEPRAGGGRARDRRPLRPLLAGGRRVPDALGRTAVPVADRPRPADEADLGGGRRPWTASGRTSRGTWRSP